MKRRPPRSTLDRSSAASDVYKRQSFAIAPEGTRKKVDKWKTGFYYIALQAGIPLIFVKFDYKNKEAHFSLPFYPSGNYEEDMKVISRHFIGTIGKNQEMSSDLTQYL